MKLANQLLKVYGVVQKTRCPESWIRDFLGVHVVKTERRDHTLIALAFEETFAGVETRSV
jgi:hypothetical protein